MDFFEADFYYQIKTNKFFLEKASGVANKPLIVWQDNTQTVPDPKDCSAILFDFKMPVFDIRFIYQKYKKLPLPAGMLLPKKTASVDFSLEIEFACLLGEGLLDFLLLHPETTDTRCERAEEFLALSEKLPGFILIFSKNSQESSARCGAK